MLTGKCPGEVDGCERGVEGKRKSLLVSRLTMCKPGELLGIAKDEFQLETCPVDVEDVRVEQEEGLLGTQKEHYKPRRVKVRTKRLPKTETCI